MAISLKTLIFMILVFSVLSTRAFGDEEHNDKKNQEILKNVLKFLASSPKNVPNWEKNATEFIEETLTRTFKNFTVFSQKEDQGKTPDVFNGQRAIDAASQAIVSYIKSIAVINTTERSVASIEGFQGQILKTDSRNTENLLMAAMSLWNRQTELLQLKLEMLESKISTKLSDIGPSFFDLRNTSKGKAPSWNGVPTCCLDLMSLGHNLNGIYTVKWNHTLKQVFCDMSKTAEQAGFQTDLGFVDVHTTRVHFHVSRSTPLPISSSVITFDRIHLNLGGSMNIRTGVFTVPKKGVYIFLGHFLKEYDRVSTTVAMKVNGGIVARAYSGTGESNTHITISLSTTLYLNIGDEVVAFLEAGKLNNGEWQYFSGTLLHEDLM